MQQNTSHTIEREREMTCQLVWHHVKALSCPYSMLYADQSTNTEASAGSPELSWERSCRKPTLELAKGLCKDLTSAMCFYVYGHTRVGSIVSQKLHGHVFNGAVSYSTACTHIGMVAGVYL